MLGLLKSALSALVAIGVLAATIAFAETPSPPGAMAYFINLKDGDTVTNPFKVQFGLSGMGIAPAGVQTPNTGHHHLIIDTQLSRTDEGADTGRCAAPAFRGWTDRGHADAAGRPTHAATRARRLRPHSAQSASSLVADQDHGEVSRRLSSVVRVHLTSSWCDARQLHCGVAL